MNLQLTHFEFLTTYAQLEVVLTAAQQGAGGGEYRNRKYPAGQMKFHETFSLFALQKGYCG
jgi:hypothetical protein